MDFSVRVTGIDSAKLEEEDKGIIDFKVKFKASDAAECVMKVSDCSGQVKLATVL
ncbi:hypothetical protein AB4251_26655 [Vibrio lentus]|uniref:hypothetical protein n=1 Tax=Vibrio lentus TaxID=136468 RepID=UPI0012FFE01D|nr:hypothetical protein [Vibrio lentus]MCC4837570.1 hypothetical protein [Vibrio lentus]